MMSHNNQSLLSPIYDSHHYAAEHNLIDPASLNIFDMAEGSYNPMLDRINPHGIVLPSGIQSFPPISSGGTPDGMSCTRKHRHDSRSNGLEDNSQDEQISSKRFRSSEDIDTTLGTPPDRSAGSGEGVGSNGDGEGVVKTKKTKGRVKISMEYIPNKLRRYTTFSKRKSGIMKKAFELSTLTGTQVMLLVASETGHVYTFATPKLQPMITSERGKALIQTCLNSPDPIANPTMTEASQRMNMQGFEEMDLNYPVINSMDEMKDIKLFSDGMAFPALSQISGLIPNTSSSHPSLNVLPSHIQMPLIGSHPTLQVNPGSSAMTYVPQHPEIIPPSSLNVPLSSPSHSPRSSPLHLAGQNINNLIVGRHKSSSRTPSPHTLSPSQSMLASSPITDNFPRLPSTQSYHQAMMLDPTSPVLTSPSLMPPDRHFINRSPNTTSPQPQQRLSPAVPQLRPGYNPGVGMNQLQQTPNQNLVLSPYHTPTGSPPSESLLNPAL